jgi:hypothetical protein
LTASVLGYCCDPEQEIHLVEFPKRLQPQEVHLSMNRVCSQCQLDSDSLEHEAND